MIIFLYDRQIGGSVEEVRRAVQGDIQYLDDVVVDYYDEEEMWFGRYFKNQSL